MKHEHSVLLEKRKLAPMEALVALYGEGDTETARAIVASLSHRIFHHDPPAPSGAVRRGLAHFALWLMRKTTHAQKQIGPDGALMVTYRNAILEGADHPYAITLLEPSRADTSSFVEGGDPMNAVYMMLVPEIRRNANLWDSIMLDSVQARDVQWRLVWETRMTHELAARRLKEDRPVRLKAAAAGTGLSMILVLNRLLEEGHNPDLITAVIGDREEANVRKAVRLMEKLPSLKPLLATEPGARGIFAGVEDLLAPLSAGPLPASDVVTLVGILEYFHGHTATTTEELSGEAAPEGAVEAAALVRAIGQLTAPDGSLVVNTYRLGAAAQILETFGKKFRYRGRPEMEQLLAHGGFTPDNRFTSGNIFDVEVFRKADLNGSR